MATKTGFIGEKRIRPARDEQARGGIRFDLLVSLCATVFVSGLYLDGWAHGHHKVDNTFFTPWHAFLYSGFVATAAVIVLTILRNHARGYRWSKAIPPGYAPAVLGIPLFLLAGVADMFWHRVFGFEIGIEQLLSPSHIALAFGGTLTISGPLRAALQRDDGSTSPSWKTLLPVILSVTVLWSVLTFFTVYADPFAATEGATDRRYTFYAVYQALGIASIFLQTVLLMGFVLIMVRRWRLPMGAFTLILTVNMIGRAVVNDEYELIPTVILAGVLIDLLYWLLQPSMKRVGMLRLSAFLVPTLLYLLYFTTLIRLVGIALSATLWLGSTILAGVVGVLLSYVMIPPASSVEEPGTKHEETSASTPVGAPTELVHAHEASAALASRQVGAQNQQKLGPRLPRRTILVGMLGLGAAMGGLIYGTRWLQRLRVPFLQPVASPGELPPSDLELMPHAIGYRPSAYHRYAAAVNSVAWAPDGQHLAVASDDGTMQVWNVSTSRTLFTYQNENSGMTGVAWAFDSKHLAAASEEGTVLVWHTTWSGGTIGKPLVFYQGQYAVRSVTWSPDGRLLASAGDDGTVQVWDASRGISLLTYSKHRGSVHSVAWSPDGRLLASAGDDGTVQVWESSTGRTRFTGRGLDSVVHSVAWSPNSKHLAAVSDNGIMQIWDSRTGNILLAVQAYSGGGAASVAWSSKGAYLALASSDKTVQVWDISTNVLLFSYHGHIDVVNSVVWSPSDQRLASASDDRTVQVWDASGGTTLLTYQKQNGPVYSAAWSPDGKRLVSVTDDGAQVWDAVTGTLLLSYQHQQGVALRPEQLPTAILLASANDAGIVQAWNAFTHITFPTEKKQHQSGGGITMVLCGAWSPDGKRIASVSNDQVVSVWDASTGSTLLTYRKHAESDSTGGVYSVAWSSDSKRIVSANSLGSVYVWDASTGITLLSYRKDTGDAVNSVAWSPNGKDLALGDNDGTARIWDTATDTILFTYLGHIRNVRAVCWSPDGKFVASTSDDSTIQVWNSSTGTRLLIYADEYTNFAGGLAWSPDGKLLAVISDSTVQIWNATRTGGGETVQVWDAVQMQSFSANGLLLTYQGHSAQVNSIAWSPDGKLLASSSDDGTVQVWQAK